MIAAPASTSTRRPSSPASAASAPTAPSPSQVRTFGTMTADLLALADWLDAEGVRHVAMESTGVYWKPVFNLLEGRFEVMLVNARHTQAGPRPQDRRQGRRVDRPAAPARPALAQLHPAAADPRAARPDAAADRAGPRPRRGGQPRSRRCWRTPTSSWASVASDVLGVSGRAMIRAMIDGQDDPERLAELAQAAAAGQDPRAEAGAGRPGHRAPSLPAAGADGPDRVAGGADRAVRRRGSTRRWSRSTEAAGRLRAIPGVGERAAEVIVAEIGPDMDDVPDGGPPGSWAGLCPGNDESAGKRRSGKTTKGSQWLRTTAGAGGVGGQPHQGDDLQRVLSAVGEAAGEEEGAGGGGAQDPGGDLAPAEGRGPSTASGGRRLRLPEPPRGTFSEEPNVPE